MADEGMDPCECLWNHEMAMRRLISLLRQGQTYCTDINCVDDEPSPSDSYDSFTIMFLMMIFGVVMYALAPRRSQSLEASKPARNPQDRDGAPPTPPTT